MSKKKSRNELCDCGSGSKYKKCCWFDDRLENNQYRSPNIDDFPNIKILDYKEDVVGRSNKWLEIYEEGRKNVGLQVVIHYDKGLKGERHYSSQDINWITTEDDIQSLGKDRSLQEFSKDELILQIDQLCRKGDFENNSYDLGVFSHLMMLYLIQTLTWKTRFGYGEGNRGFVLSLYLRKDGGISCRDCISLDFKEWISFSGGITEEILNHDYNIDTQKFDDMDEWYSKREMN